jgi:hypothetical protein
VDYLDPETKLGRFEGAAELTKEGYKTSPSTLSTLASRGGGPLFQKFGKRVVYRWADLLAWAESRTSKRVASTSELPQRELSVER